jgi:hypothetical protein
LCIIKARSNENYFAKQTRSVYKGDEKHLWNNRIIYRIDEEFEYDLFINFLSTKMNNLLSNEKSNITYACVSFL